jgi:hypothetical protein
MAVRGGHATDVRAGSRNDLGSERRSGAYRENLTDRATGSRGVPAECLSPQ